MNQGYTPAEVPADEAQRVAALHALEVLDTAPEDEFDALVKAASLVCGVPISLICLVDSDRQWFKAMVGLDTRETPRDWAFCAHAILGDEIFEVPDALEDARFSGNPLVTDLPNIRFYAGAPLTLTTGERIGTFCVIDREPRRLDTTQREILSCLARSAASMLERRVQALRTRELQGQLEERQSALRESETRYHFVVDAMIAGVVLQDAQGAILSSNASAEALLGLTHAQMLGKTSLDPSWHCVHEDLTPWPGDTHPSMVALQTGKEVRDAVMGVYKPDGHITWLTINVRPIFQPGSDRAYQIVTSFTDISSRKHAEDALRQRERFLQTLTQVLPGLIGYWDTEWTLQYANDAYKEWYGKTAEELNGIHIRELLGPAVYEANRPFMEAAFAGDMQRFERTITKADGSTTHVVAEYIPDVSQGKVVGIVVMVTDVTQIKLRQLLVEHLNSELEHTTGLAQEASLAKSRFLANMSHEIRTPMNAILGMLSLLGKTELNYQQTDYVTKSRGAANALLSLLNDILDISKVEAGKLALDPQPFRPDAMLRDLAVILSSYVGNKRVEVLFDIDATLPEVLVLDSYRLQQVLINLASNAVKFTAAGEVVVRIQVVDMTPSGRARLQFSVRDTGIGIAQDAQAKMFTDFMQAEASTTRQYGGTGLGLAISQRLIQMMGGVIELSSELGKGSLFFFTLDAQVPTDIPEDLRSVRAFSLEPRRTLVVDDNVVAGDLTVGIVKSWNWPVQVARSGHEALALVARSGAGEPFAFQVIYLDWHMPDMDGWELAGKIRELATLRGTPQPVIVMVTGQSREYLAQRTVQEQSLLDAFLVKPMTASMLQEAAVGGAAHDFKVRKDSRGKASERRLAGMRILVVEDNLINQQVAEELLVSEGALVSLAANGQLGVEAVAAARPQFDVVLMDVQMPVMDGYSATRFIRDNLDLKDLLVVAMTANAMASDRTECLAAGMNEHVGKPFDVNKLVKLLLALTGRTAPGASAEERNTGLPSPAEKQTAVSGIDLQTALLRLSGSQAMYLRAAREFLKILPAEIDQFLRDVQSDLAAATLQMHSLKGVAALVGANGLSEAAAALEKACRAKTGHEALRAQAQRMQPLVDATLVGLAQAVALLDTTGGDATDNPHGGPTAQQGMPVDSGNLVQALVELEALLAESNFASLEKFAECQQALGDAVGAALDPLEQAMQNLDMPLALEASRNIRKRLGG